MLSNLLSTKLYFPPVRPIFVHRARLVARLQHGLTEALTLVSAPAGSGKTCLLSEWRAGPGAGCPVAWVSLDTADNDPLRFFCHLFASLDMLRPGLLQDFFPVLDSQTAIEPETILEPLVNILGEDSRDLLIALDDYHVIETPIIHQALGFLLDHRPANLHLVLLTRSDPPLPLARLRVRGQLVEIRAEHLRFSVDECAEFLNQIMGLDLSDEAIAALEKRTEGWVAGLQLAALSLQGHADQEGFISAFTGSHQYIVDYLIEEVLSRQPEAVQTFLVQTSILERLTGELCDAVTGQSDSEAILKYLAQANLFLISLDDERRWFRYHHLFADLLRNRLQRKAPELVRQLHQRAAAWYDSHQMAAEAVEQAFAAQDYVEVKRLLRRHFPSWMRVENTMRIYHWFELFPREFLHAEPWLCVVYAWMIWRLGKADETGRCLQVAQNALDRMLVTDQFPRDDPEYISLQSEIYAFQGLVASQTDDPHGAETLAMKALSSAPEGAPIVRAIAHMVLSLILRNRGDLGSARQACEAGLKEALIAGETGTIVSLYQNLGSILLIQGHLSQADEVYQQALAYAESNSQAHYPTYGLIRMRLANLCYLRNRLDEAEIWLKPGLERVDFGSYWWGMIYGRYLQGLIQSARGQRQAMQQTFQAIEEIMPKISGAYFASQLNTLLILVRALLGLPLDPAAGSMPLQISQDTEPDTNQFERLLMQVKARHLLDGSENLTEILAWLENIAIRRGYVFYLIEIYILQAITWQKKGKRQSASASLAKALNLAKPEAILRPFLDGGEPVSAILKQAEFKLANADHQPFISELLKAFGFELPFQTVVLPAHSCPLSKREIELLGLIAAGRSNKEIASELCISIGTVKRHTVNIFNKLDVKNRTEAVAKARELGLL